MRATALPGTDPARTPQRRSTRPIGREIRALIWLLRHPSVTAVPALLAWAGSTVGPIWTGSHSGPQWCVAGSMRPMHTCLANGGFQ